MTIFLFVQFFKDLPKDLIEAARVDGATWFQIYRRVVMPLCGPVLATAAILKFLVMYNQYIWPLMVTQSEDYRPVMVGLGYFFQLREGYLNLKKKPGGVCRFSVRKMLKPGGVALITVPVLAFYLVLQRAFISSFASTGIKG